MSESLIIGDLCFDLRWSPRRKTVGVTVERDGGLVLSAPVDCPTEVIEQVAQRKQLWVYQKLAERAGQVQPPATEFVTGAGFYYLGRSYRLLLVEPTPSCPALRLYQGRFMLRRDEQQHGEKHFIAWYTQHSRRWLQERVARMAGRIDVTPQEVVIRELGFRWGACAPNGIIYFNWRTIRLPPPMIDYLIAHELVHLREPQHDAAFWQCLARVVPECAAHKQWLAEHGGRFC